MKFPNKKIWLSALFCAMSYCAPGAEIFAATRTAASASYADVSAAVSSASAGDTVVVPAGTATWSSSLNINKGIILKGAGIGSTVINSGVSNAYGFYLIDYAPSNPSLNEAFELSGFTFDGGYKSGLLSIRSNSNTTAISNLKVHDNKFANAYSRAISMPGLEFGVFYKNQFQDNYISISDIGSEMNGWNYPLTQGGANYPFFEDNTFTQTIARGGFIVETGRGGRIAFRYNTISNYGGSGAEVFDAHGVNGTYPTDTGTVSSEYYKNTIGLSSGARVFNHRGGKAIFANNKISGSGYLGMTEYQGWSYCTSQGYPKYQQVNNSFYWNNSSMTPSLYCSSGSCSSCGQYDSTYIQPNRDYWQPAAGLDSSRPSTCTAGSYYAATDTDIIYKCNSGNTWSVHYKPYTYPHPLRGGSASGTTAALQPPTGLRVIP